MHKTKILVAGISLGGTAEDGIVVVPSQSRRVAPRRSADPIGQCAMPTSLSRKITAWMLRCAGQDCLIRRSHSGYAAATAAACRAEARAEVGAFFRIWYRGARPSVNWKLCSSLYDVFVPRRTSPRTSFKSAVFPAFASTVQSSPPCSNLLIPSILSHDLLNCL